MSAGNLDDLIELRDVLALYIEAVGVNPEDQAWIERIDDQIAQAQKQILLAAVEATGGWEDEA